MNVGPLFVFALFACFNSCATRQHVPLEEQLQSVLDTGIDRSEARGVSAAIVYPDGTSWIGTSGISHDTVSVKPEMVFAIGSITKNVVATLVLRLVEEGVLSLEDPISLWLPAYPNVDASITVRQLLNHTSGVYNFFDSREAWEELEKDRKRIWAPEEVLSFIEEPYFEPGEGWRYSNTNYLLTAMIIEKATGKQLAEMMRQYIWEPYGLTSAFLSTGDSLPQHMAHVYGDNVEFGNEEDDITFEPRASHESMIYGSGGLFMTARDLASWCNQLFEGHVLEESSMQEMLQFVTFRQVSNIRAYGLGTYLYERKISSGRKAIGHGGGNIGTTAYMVYLPESHVSIVVMVNAFPTGTIDVITKGVIRAVLRQRGEIGPLPYIPLLPHGVAIAGFAAWLVAGLAFLYRKRRARTTAAPEA